MFQGILKNHLTLISIVVALIIVACVPLFVHSPYILDLMITIIVRTVLAITFIMLLRTGMINLGIVAFFGVGAYTSAVLVEKLGLSFWLSLPASAVITGIFALILGLVIIERGRAGFSFVLLTAIIGMLFSVAVGNIDYLGSYIGFPFISRPDTINLPLLPEIVFSATDKVPYYFLALFLFVIVILVIKALFSSQTGRAWTAIGLNPQQAESLGIDVYKYKLLVFVTASVLLGLFGSFYAHYMTFIKPSSFGMWVNIYIQVYAILGGIGYIILGPLVGASVMITIPELTRVFTDYAPIIQGTLLIVLILFLPEGLLGLGKWRFAIMEGLSKIRSRIVKSLSPSK